MTRECRIVQIRSADKVEHISEYAAMIKNNCMDIMAGPYAFGTTDVMKLAALAEVRNMKMKPHDFGGGTASLHVLLAITNADYHEQATPEGCFDSAMYPGVYLDPIWVDSDGYVHAPTKPGLGFGIDLKEPEKVTVQTL